MHNLYIFVEIPRYLEIPLIDFCETHTTRDKHPKYIEEASNVKRF